MTHILEIEVEIVGNRDISDLTYKKCRAKHTMILRLIK